jgi:glutamine synthetase
VRIEPEGGPVITAVRDVGVQDLFDKDRAFLTTGGVFSDDMLNAYIALKMEEVTRFRMTTHPVEFDMYYSL